MSESTIGLPRAGTSFLRSLCSSSLRTLRNAFVIEGDRQPLAVLIPYSDYMDIQRALIAASALFEKGHALSNFNWGASALTAENIRELNELPGTIRAAIAKTRGEA